MTRARPEEPAGDDRRIRVVELIDDASVGGGQRHVLDLATRLDRGRFEVAVLCEGRGWLVDELARAGIPVEAVRISNRPDPRAWRALRRLFRRIRPHILHTHGGTAGFHGRLAARGLRCATVHTYHGLHALRDSGARAAIFRAVDRALARRTDRLICVSAGDLALARDAGLAPVERSLAIPNGIDVSAYAEAGAWREARRAERRAATRPDELVVGTIGRLSPEKGHIHLVEAAGLLRDHGVPARVVIVGEGEERPRLEARRRELALGERVELPGARYDVARTLSEFDLFALPSHWEGHPIALLEAIAAGLPVVASEIDGVRAITRGTEAAILVPPEDPAALAAAIESLARDPARGEAMARAGLAAVRDRFDVAATVRAVEGVYEEVFADVRRALYKS